MKSIEEIGGYEAYCKKLLRAFLSDARYQHSLNVAEKAAYLAEKYGENIDKARTAGLLHDITKEMPKEKQLKLINDGGIILSCDEAKCDKVWHAYASAAFAKTVLKISDREILDAIASHTTGKAGMSRLSMIIFLSDMISDERSYPEVGYLRELSEKDIVFATKEALRLSIEFLTQKEGTVCENTVLAWEYLERNV